MGGAAGPVGAGRERARVARGGAGGPCRGGVAADPRDRCDLLRDLEARRAAAVDVGALRRRGDPPPDQRLAADGPRHRRCERLPLQGRRRRAAAGARRQRVRRRLDRARDARHGRRRSGAAVLHLRHDRTARRASCTPTATCSGTRSSTTATTSSPASASTAWASGRGRPGIVPLLGPWRAAPCSACYQREAGLRPASPARLPLSPRGRRMCSRRRRRSAR